VSTFRLADLLREGAKVAEGCLILLVRGFSLRRSGLCSVACHLRRYDALYRLAPLRIYCEGRAKGTTKVYTRSVPPKVSVFHVEVGIPNKKGGPLRSRRLELMLSLPVDFDFYTWSAMFVMIVTVSLVHVATVSLAHV
jgi:hypothetical protein